MGWPLRPRSRRLRGRRGRFGVRCRFRRDRAALRQAQRPGSAVAAASLRSRPPHPSPNYFIKPLYRIFISTI
ncbi:MAG: hypothetical protein RMJ53_00800 [Chitinophagales bacterium]|nr:hypothetical protein [Chitinophagales bacterium]